MLPWTLKRAKIGKECIIFSSDKILLIVTRLCGSFRMSKTFSLGTYQPKQIKQENGF